MIVVLARNFAVCMVLIATLMNATAAPAFAAVTPTVCDGSNKYWCKQVDYTPLSGGASGNVRNIKGAVDGGAFRWQRLWVTDWTYADSNGWTASKTWGEGPWRENITMSDSFIDSIVESRSMYAAQIAISFVARYEARYYQPPGGYTYDYWCGERVDVYIHPFISNYVSVPPAC